MYMYSDTYNVYQSLSQELDKSQAEKEEIQSKFLLEGKELVRNRESLAAEMDSASKDEVWKNSNEICLSCYNNNYCVFL